MAQWLTLMPRNREAAGSNLWGFGFSLKGAYYEVGYCGKKTFLAGLQCTLTSSCAKTVARCRKKTKGTLILSRWIKMKNGLFSVSSVVWKKLVIVGEGLFPYEGAD